MRPVRLEVEGFTCYRDRQEPLDFTGLSLFAIAGPTGAGKSSILDTMLYALYGVVPRMGRQNLGDLIAHGRDALSVCLDFRVRGVTYRVTRRVKRGRHNALSTTATLAELTAAGEKNIADGVKTVNAEIEKLLGLDFDAFTQTVVLPQGEFAKFLRAERKDQRGILQHLLRHEVFSRMRDEAERRRSAADTECKAVERQLLMLAHATDDALASARVRLESERARLVVVEQEKTEREASLQDVRIRRQLTEDVQTLRADRQRLEAAAPQVAAARDELARSRRAAEIAPRLEACAAADERLRDASRAKLDAEAAVARCALGEKGAAASLARAGKESEERPALAARIRAIDEIKGDLARRDALSAQRVALERQLADAKRQLTLATTAESTARTTRDAAASALAAARQALDGAGYDPVEHQQFDSLGELALQARHVDEERARLVAEHAQHEAAIERARRIASQHDRALEKLDRDLESARTNDHDSALALEEAKDRHQAAAVRVHLHVGDACPVCLQTVATLPDVEPVPELDALARAREQARQTLTATDTRRQAAAEKRAAANAALDGAVRAVEVSRRALQNKIDAHAELVAKIAAAIAPLADATPHVDVVSLVETRRSELRAAKLGHERAVERLRAAEREAAAEDVGLVRADADLVSARERHDRLVADEASARTEWLAVADRIAAVSTAEDPSVERAALAQRLDALDRALRTAQAAVADVRTRLAAATARAAAAASAVEDATMQTSRAKAALDAAIAANGFENTDAVTAALRTPAAQSDLDATVRRHDDEQASVTNRLLGLEPRLGGREVSADALAEEERRCKAAFDTWRAVEIAISSLAVECDRLASENETRKRVLADLEAQRARLALHAEMASDLQGNAFQEYLLEEAFHALVAGASLRMRQMSNRYTLEWDASNFFVVDHDNAGERRRAETLSGGETFMASLCLALQLSDEVLKTSGALQMDSLFIDEGFGTLDAESLAEVTDAMEALHEDGARLIGVISHRAELTERLPGCIRVVKGAGESRWVLERVA